MILGSDDINHDDYDDEIEDYDGPNYKAFEALAPNGIRSGLSSLALFDSDMNLSMQAMDLNIVDRFLTEMEYSTLRMHFNEEAEAGPQMALQAALSKMWIFSAYEILRTWRQRATLLKRCADNFSLQKKLNDLKAKSKGEMDFGSKIRIAQFQEAIDNPELVKRIGQDLRRTHRAYALLEMIRIMLAKHEMRGSKTVYPVMPGYGGRLNKWCGSLEYELGGAQGTFDTTSRRDIAESIRWFGESLEIPSDEELAEFDTYMEVMADPGKFTSGDEEIMKE